MHIQASLDSVNRIPTGKKTPDIPPLSEAIITRDAAPLAPLHNRLSNKYTSSTSLPC